MVGLYTELFYAVFQTLFFYFLLFHYPYMLLHINVFYFCLIVNLTVTLGFEYGLYIVSEHIGSSKVCIEAKNGVPQSLLHLSLTTVDGTATGNHATMCD